MTVKIGRDITNYGCGHTKVGGQRIGVDKIINCSLICYDCQQAMIGTRQNVVRYGEIPESGLSYNYRDSEYEKGVSCYLNGMRARPEFTEGRNKLVFSAIVIGWGGDSEPLIDHKTIKFTED